MSLAIGFVVALAANEPFKASTLCYARDPLGFVLKSFKKLLN